jgi:hypothetical protein
MRFEYYVRSIFESNTRNMYNSFIKAQSIIKTNVTQNQNYRSFSKNLLELESLIESHLANYLVSKSLHIFY